MRLGDFINSNIEPILVEWEAFAKTIEPPALTMDSKALRNHAVNMLQDMARDLSQPQTAAAQQQKSLGAGRLIDGESSAEVHAAARLFSGFTIEQLVSEYRALRASVLKMWARESKAGLATDPDDVTRFNEAVDQSVAESVARYAEMVSKSQNLFLAILGHDLRNPLGTIVTGSSFVMQATDIPPKYVLVATRMFNSAKRMSKLINDLIDFTRTHLGPGIPIRVKQASLVAVCEEVVNELRTFHPEKQIDLDAPPQLDAIFDESRIAQVLSNLIGNAIQYGNADVPAKVRLARTGDDIVITVTNLGAPIAPEKLSSIFDPMVRLAAAETGDYIERTSLGIGLFISREIVHAHGGKLSVASDEKNGTTFTVAMPRLPKGFQSHSAEALS